jgi:hypothetical protein
MVRLTGFWTHDSIPFDRLFFFKHDGNAHLAQDIRKKTENDNNEARNLSKISSLASKPGHS